MSEVCARHEGTVLKVKGERAVVEIERVAECNGCKACMLAGNKRKVVLPAVKTCEVSVGETVSVLLPPPRPVTAMLLLFALPLFTLIAAVTVAFFLTQEDIFLFVAALAGLGVGLIVVFMLDRLYLSKKYIAKIVKNQGENDI